jgi:membrane protein YdbS with pleckstrin-like domain
MKDQLLGFADLCAVMLLVILALLAIACIVDGMQRLFDLFPKTAWTIVAVIVSVFVSIFVIFACVGVVHFLSIRYGGI